MPKQRGKWQDILKDKKLIKKFKDAYFKLPAKEILKLFSITNWDYVYIRNELQLKKRIFRKKHGMAKFLEQEPLDPTVMDFTIIMRWDELRAKRRK